MTQLNSNMQEGMIILVIGMSIVFLSLVLLHQVFEYIVPFFFKLVKKREPVVQDKKASDIPRKANNSGEEMAAIAAAVYAFLEETHDEENVILTISQSSKNYSPWSSKIYTTYQLRNQISCRT